MLSETTGFWKDCRMTACNDAPFARSLELEVNLSFGTFVRVELCFISSSVQHVVAVPGVWLRLLRL